MSGPTFIEGDIIARDFDPGNPTSLDAFLANPDRKWPSGTVEYRFYHTFPTANREIVRRAMDYITNKVSCITFQPATESTRDYVLILDSAHSCSSDLGRVGGEQVLHLNR